MDNVDWLNLALGSLMGLLVPYLAKVLSALMACIRGSTLTGQWFVYHRAIADTGECTLISSMWQVRTSREGRLRVREYRSDSGDGRPLRYVGTMCPLHGYLLCELAGVGFEESASMYVRDAVPGYDRELPGIFLARGLRSDITAGPLLLSRVQLSGEDASLRLGQTVDSKEELLNLRG